MGDKAPFRYRRQSRHTQLRIKTGGFDPKLPSTAPTKRMYTQGAAADSVFYIQSGNVKNTVVSELGKEAVVALLGIGDFFGEGCLSGQPKRLATVSAMTECVIVRITKAEITRLIHEEPAFAELFIAHLLARNERVEGI